MAVTDLGLLRVLSLKGLAGEQAVHDALRTGDSRARIDAALAAGDVRELPRGFALTPQGRAGVAEGIAAEAGAVDGPAIDALYERFCTLNAAFKALMRDWQVRQTADGEVPNDHGDDAYDDALVERLGTIDQELTPLLDAIVAVAPRLAGCAPRFADALAALRAGDKAMMARPMIDSYHTVWFELHEDLIGLTGRTRAAEAAAGRGD